MAGPPRDRRRDAAGLGRRESPARSPEAAARSGADRGCGSRHRRSHRRRGGRGECRAARTDGDGAAAAETRAGHARLSLRAALVRDHRPARRRQDDGAAQCRPALPARRRDGPGRRGRRRRHAALRLVVHRERRDDRHGGPLHHAGFRRRRRPRRLGGVPRPAEAHPHAPAAQRRDRRHRAQRHRPSLRRRAPRPCSLHPPSRHRVGDPPRRPHPGLRDAHQGRPDRRLHRVLRRPRPREAGAGLGCHFSARRGRGGAGGILRRGIPRPGAAARRAAVRPSPGRAQPRSPGIDRRLPRPGRQSGAAADGLPAGSVRRLAARPGAAAARRVPDLRHAGGHADRPADRHACARLRPGSAPRTELAARARTQLFPRTPAARGDPRRGDAGLGAAGGGASEAARARRRFRRRVARCARRGRPAVAREERRPAGDRRRLRRPRRV